MNIIIRYYKRCLIFFFLFITGSIKIIHAYCWADYLNCSSQNIKKIKSTYSVIEKFDAYCATFYPDVSQYDSLFIEKLVQQAGMPMVINNQMLSYLIDNVSPLGRVILVDVYYYSKQDFLNDLNFTLEKYEKIITLLKQDVILHNLFEEISIQEKKVFSLFFYTMYSKLFINVQLTYKDIVLNDGTVTKVCFKEPVQNNYKPPIKILYVSFLVNLCLLMELAKHFRQYAMYDINAINFTMILKSIFLPLLSCAGISMFRVFDQNTNFLISTRPYFVALRKFLATAEKIGNHLITHYADILNEIPVLRSLTHIKQKKMHSNAYNNLLLLLKKNTFKGHKPTLFCNLNIIKEAYRNFAYEGIKEIGFIISAIGILQLYRGIGNIQEEVILDRSNPVQADIQKIEKSIIDYHNHTVPYINTKIVL